MHGYDDWLILDFLIAFDENEKKRKIIDHFETLKEMFLDYNFEKKLQKVTST